MKISTDIINDIADNLEMGVTCYLNKETCQLVTIPGKMHIDFEDDNDLDELEPWYEDVKIIMASPDSFVQIEEMNSTESFRIMEDYIETVEDENWQRRLLYAIQMRKPFANFRDEINNAGEAERERWFAFKRERLIDYVKDQLGIGQ